MTPADKRVMDLLERWLTSIELHLKYADLDDARYRQMQPWPQHERPARWILELAQQKVLSLKTLCKIHRSDDDPSFAESLELMCFLANLVGAQHIQRFIPLADPARETTHIPETEAIATASQAAAQPKVVPVATPVSVPTLVPAAKATVIPIAAATARPKESDNDEHTREMPRFKQANKRAAQHPVKATQESTPKRAPLKAIQTAGKPAAQQFAANASLNEVVVADAVRLLRWGRQWHEIAELIARMAERPNIADVRKILRTNKPEIDKQLEA